jgi:hypothetical protein
LTGASETFTGRRPGHRDRAALSLSFGLQVGGAAGFDLEIELAVRHIDRHLVAGLHRSGQDEPRELVLDQPLDRPP